MAAAAAAMIGRLARPPRRGRRQHIFPRRQRPPLAARSRAASSSIDPGVAARPLRTRAGVEVEVEVAWRGGKTVVCK